MLNLFKADFSKRSIEWIDEARTAWFEPMTIFIHRHIANPDEHLMLMLQASQRLRSGLAALAQLRDQIAAAERPRLADTEGDGVGAELIDNMPVPGLPAPHSNQTQLAG